MSGKNSRNVGGIGLDTLLMAIAFKVQALPPNSVYQVLIGKRTATTLFFAFSNNLTAYFGLYPKLTKDAWMSYTQNVAEYISVEAIFRQNDQINYMHLLVDDILQKRNGLIIPSHHHKHHLAFKLLLQVLSNIQAENPHYSPIVQDLEVQQLIKDFISMAKSADAPQAGLQAITKSLHQQLAKELSAFPDQAALIFLEQFEGAKLPAQTLEQVAENHQISKRAVVITQQALMDQIYQNWVSGHTLGAETQWLQIFAQGVFNQFPIWNQTTQDTLNLINQGWSLQKIADKRRLKLSTITEHIIEITLSFPWIIQPIVVEELNLKDISPLVSQEPDENYESFKARFGEKEYWLYRYWHIVYQKGAHDDRLA